MNKLKLMEAFIRTVDEGSFVRAAKRLGVTKAAVSKQVIELEASLKTQLLIRTTRSMQLTDVGQAYYESVKRVLDTIAESEAIIEKTQGKPTGILRITSHRYFGEKFIVPNLKYFINQYPHLKIHLELADRSPDLLKEDVDIFCGVGQDESGDLVRKKVLSTRHVLCAASAYLKKYGHPKILDDLKRHRYITHSFRNPDNDLRFYNKTINLDYVLRINDSQAMLACALEGLGIISVHDYIAAPYLQNGDLIEILSQHPLPEKSIYVCYQQKKYIQPKIRLFLDFIYEKMNLSIQPYDGIIR